MAAATKSSSAPTTHKCRAWIGPSVLASDMACLAAESKRVIAEGADYIHLDVMDGHFVPNLTFGAPVIKSLRKNLPRKEGTLQGKQSVPFFDVHLMVTEPEKWIEDMSAAGCDNFTFHIEAMTERKLSVDDMIAKVRASGMTVGIAVKPATPASAVESYISKIDQVLVMTVEPGFGGQKFMEDMMPKIAAIRRMANAANPTMDIGVDGGLSPKTIDAAASAGANMIVAGSSVFKAEDAGAAMRAMRESVVRLGHGGE